jgi:NitT/TauT family transport system substrate-binding protein
MNHLTHYICVFTFVLLAGCTDSTEQSLRLGTNVWPGYEPLYLARHRGDLTKDKVHLVEFSSSSQTIQAYRNNLIDAAALTLDEVLLLLESGETPKIILVMDISNGGDVIIGQSDMTSLADIKGKNVGVENGALGAYMIARALEIAGLDRKSINIVPLDVNEQKKAFLQHKIDAVVTFDPVSSNLIKSGGQLLFDSSQLPVKLLMC